MHLRLPKMPVHCDQALLTNCILCSFCWCQVDSKRLINSSVWKSFYFSDQIYCSTSAKMDVFRIPHYANSWWRQEMGTFSALLAICAGNSPVIGEFHAQRPVTQSFNVFVDLRLNKRLSKQSRGWWLETPSRPLWRHCNVTRWPLRDRDVIGT